MYNNPYLKKYYEELTKECEQHPFYKEITTEQYKANLKKYAFYLQHVFASVDLPQYDFFNYLNNCDVIEQDNGTIELYQKIANEKYKFLYILYFNDVIESYQDKLNIIESQDKPQVHLYCYDVKSKKTLALFNNYYINALFGNDAYNPNEYFTRVFESKKLLPQDAINELKEMFVNMPNDYVEIEEPTQYDLFTYQEELDKVQNRDANEMWQSVVNDIANDTYNGNKEQAQQEMQQEYGTPLNFKNELLQDAENDKINAKEYGTSIRIIESKEHQLFNVLIRWFDVLFEYKKIQLQTKYGFNTYDVKSYYDLIQAYATDRQKQIDAMQQEYNAMIYPTINEFLQQVDASRQSEVKNKLQNDLMVCKDWQYIQMAYNPNIQDHIKYESIKTQYDNIVNQPQYYGVICKEILQQDIESQQNLLKEEQTKMNNITTNGSIENYINEQVKKYIAMVPTSALDKLLVGTNQDKADNIERNFNISSSNIGYFDNGYLRNNAEKIPFRDVKQIENTTINANGKMAPLYVGFNVINYNNTSYQIVSKTNEKPTQFDYEVLDAIGTGTKNFESKIADAKPIMSVADIYKYTFGAKDKMDNEKQDAIIKSLLKLNDTWILIDASSELTKEELDKGNTRIRAQKMLNFNIVINNNRGQNTTSIELIETPPLWQRAKNEDHILSYELNALNWQPNNTNETLAMKKYLIKRIKNFESTKTKEHKDHIKNGKAYRVKIDTLLNECGIEFTNKSAKVSKSKFINDKIIIWLKQAVAHQMIESFFCYTDVNTTTGVASYTKSKPIMGIEIAMDKKDITTQMKNWYNEYFKK